MKKQQKHINRISSISLLLLLFTLMVTAQGIKNQNADTLRKIVDIAYGTQPYNAVTGAISTIYAPTITKQIVPMVGDALVGRLPGLTVRKSSGMPGSVAQLIIRGQSTFNNSSPLVIVDGFKSDLNSLSQFEIESISILKDAAATVMYGMDAANGVVLVTTKRGKQGKMKIDATVNYGVQMPTQLPELLNASQYAVYYNQARANDGLPFKYDAIADIPNYGKEGDFMYTHPDNNYIDEFLRKTAPMLVGGLNISGGNDKAKYMVSLGFLANQGLLNHTNQNKYSTQNTMDKVNVRTNLDVNVMKGLTASVDVAVVFDNRNYPGNSVDGIMGTLLQLPPQAFPIYNKNGTLGGNSTYKNNPMGMIAKSGYQTSLQRNLDVNLRLKYDFDKALKGLTVGIAGSSSTWMTLWDNKTRSYASYSIVDPSDLATTTYTQHGDSTNLVWSTDVIAYKRMSFDAHVSYTRTFGNHKIEGLVMAHSDRYVQQMRTVNPYNYDNAGLALRLNYSLSDTYFAEFAGSYYGQEQYNPDNRFRFFPTGSLVWVASNEDFIKNIEQINYLKIRSSYGVVGGGSGLLFPGNDVKSRLFYAQYYQKLGGVSFGETNSFAPGTAAYQLGQLANPAISSDRAAKFNIGFEAGLLKHLNVKFDYYNENRTNILDYNSLLPQTMGFAGRMSYTNGGEVKNSGYELDLDYSNTVGEFSYLVNAGVWYNKSKIIKRPNVIPLPGIDNRSGLGMPVGQYFGYEAIGFYETDDDAKNATVKQSFGDTQAGDVIYKDNTGDDKIDISDMVPLGFSFIPQYTYTMSFELKYKRFSLAAMAQGTMNSSIMLGGYVVPFSTQGNAFKSFTENSWSPANADANYPRLSTTANSNNTQSSSIWLVSGDYLKIRNLELGYEISDKTLKKMNFEAVRFYVKGLDLFTFANGIKHVDPETLSYYPAMKSVTMGVSLKF
jgi:TonB-linked SusC/RagA family outer membrane protein